MLENAFSAEEKAEIIRRVTDAFDSVAGDTIRADTLLRLLEVQSGSWGYGGTVLTTEDALRMLRRG